MRPQQQHSSPWNRLLFHGLKYLERRLIHRVLPPPSRPLPSLRQDEALSQRRQLESLFAKDTADAYRVFDTMEHFLRQPEHLRGQLQVQLGAATQVCLCTRLAVDSSGVKETRRV